MDLKLQQDISRYSLKKAMPKYQIYFRKYQSTSGILKQIYRLLYSRSAHRMMVEIPKECKIGGGLFLGHPHGITINRNVVIGENCNIHKGVTIGQENRGTRKGVPTIGNCVWIGVNATVVGNIHIGNDVLIAPNTLVNCDVPDHSVVIGNPCVIKPRENATEGYIERKI